jgi:hypothetical protein
MPQPDPVKYTAVSWRCMLARCYNPNDPDYERYGKKGITVCERWRTSFAFFLADMGFRPQDHTIDRKESTGNYEPTNCRWATATVQNRHSRREITYKGRTQSLGEWAVELGIRQTTLTMRLKNLSVEDAFTKPVAK